MDRLVDKFLVKIRMWEILAKKEALFLGRRMWVKPLMRERGRELVFESIFRVCGGSRGREKATLPCVYVGMRMPVAAGYVLAADWAN